jgi:hypothetical protein
MNALYGAPLVPTAPRLIMCMDYNAAGQSVRC